MNNSAQPFSKNELNTAKGIGITLVVLGHMSFMLFDRVHIYIYHMPLFFFLSGMTLSPARSLWETIAHHFKSLLLYAAAMTFVYSVIGNLIQGYTAFKLVSFEGFGIANYTTKLLTANGHHVLLFLVAWFLVALFFARPLAVVLVKGVSILPRSFHAAALLGVALLLGYAGMSPLARLYHSTGIPYLNLVAQVSVGSCFVLLGYLAAESTHVRRLVRHPLAGFALAIGLYESVMLLGVRPLGMAWSEYPAGLWRHTLGALLATLVALNVASIISQTGRSNLLAVVGTHSRSVMAHHLFVFVMINISLAAVGVIPQSAIVMWYNWMPDRTWPLYVLLGVGLPVLFSVLMQRILDRIQVSSRMADLLARVSPFRQREKSSSTAA